MESKTNYTIVGVIVLVLTAALLSTGLWLSVGFNKKAYSFYTVYLHEAAAGLAPDSPVKYNGVQVGFVKKIKLNATDPRQVEITLSIEEGIPITTSTSATLNSQGITGVTYVGLSASSGDLTLLQKMPGEPYPVIPAKPSLFKQIDSVLKDVSESINKVGDGAEQIFTNENALYIKNSLANMEKISGAIASNSENISSTLANADIFLNNLTQVSKDFPQIIKELKKGVAKFNSLTNDLSTASKSVTSTMVAGKGTLDKISQQTLPPAVLLLRRLNAISANLEKLSREIRQNPSVIIRGSAAPKPGPGE